MTARPVPGRAGPRHPQSGWRGWSHDFVAALRGLVASPRYAIPAVLSIAIGVGATTAIFVIFDAVVLKPLPYPNENELTVVLNDMGIVGLEKMPVSVPELNDYTRNVESFASVAAYNDSEAIVGGSPPRHIRAAYCTLNLFEIINGRLERGRGFVSSGASRDDVDVAIVTHRFWTSLGSGPIGRTIVVDGIVRTIVGVVSDEQALPATADVWLPLKVTDQQAAHAGDRFLFAVARLKPGVSLERAQHELSMISQIRQASARGASRRVRAFLIPLREVLLGSSRNMVAIVFAAVALFCLLACTNVVLLLLARASVRSREFAVRAALGASPRRLRRHAFLEAFSVSLCGGLLGIGISQVLLWLCMQMYGDQLANVHPSINGRVIAFFLLLCSATAMIIGVSPAFHASQTKPIEALRADGRASSGKGNGRIRQVLVAVQIAATVALLICAGILARSVLALTRVDPGFDAVGVVTARVSLPRSKYDDALRTTEYFRRAIEAIDSLPGIDSAAVASFLPLSDVYEVAVKVDAVDIVTERVLAEERRVTPDYFRALKIGFRQGRGFSTQDRADTERVAIVNATFARTFYGDISPVGKRLDIGGRDGADWHRIVGVVQDTLDFGLDSLPKPTFFLPFAQSPTQEASVLVRTLGNPDDLLRQLPARLSAIDAEMPIYDVAAFQRTLERSYLSRTLLWRLLATFALAALLLAAVGIFGATSYSVSQRFQEIAIRRAIGATRGTIMRMVMYETAVLVGLSVLGGMSTAFYATKFMSSLIFGITTSDPLTYFVMSLVVAIVSLAAALPPVRAAAKVSPLVALTSG